MDELLVILHRFYEPFTNGWVLEYTKVNFENFEYSLNIVSRNFVNTSMMYTLSLNLDMLESIFL